MPKAKTNFSDIDSFLNSVSKEKQNLIAMGQAISSEINNALEQITSEKQKVSELQSLSQKGKTKIENTIEKQSAELSNLKSKLTTIQPIVIGKFTDEAGNEFEEEKQNPEYVTISQKISDCQKKLNSNKQLQGRFSNLTDNIQKQSDTLNMANKELINLSVDLVQCLGGLEFLSESAITRLKDIKKVLHNYAGTKIESPNLDSVSYNDNDGFNADQNVKIQGFNENPHLDTEKSFDFVNSIYSKDSIEWQENAYRLIEINESKIKELTPKFNEIESKKNEIDDLLFECIRDNNLTPESCKSNVKYQELLKESKQINLQYNNCKKEIDKYQNKIDLIKDYINPEMKTTFVGFNGSDFEHAYDNMITQKQGHAFKEIQGCCGENATVNIVNVLTGTKKTEKEGLDIYLKNGWCDYNEKGNPNENGRTIFEQRKNFLNMFGISSTEIKTTKLNDNNKLINLNVVEKNFKAGVGCSLVFKAEDLNQESIYFRKKSIFLKYKNFQNHIAVITGVSHFYNGKIAGIWINDTGSSISNRIFISEKKFEQMKKNTIGFGLEFSK